MLFNSIDFALFIPVVFTVYWFLLYRNLKLQNLLILISSYIFYGWWDYRFLSLIFISTLVDYSIGKLITKEDRLFYRKVYLWISISINLGFLFFFKYYNFFVISFTEAFSFFGSQININSLHIILPVGISFYTFQTLSYTIDIYRKKLSHQEDFIAFAAFVSFFPQLVAGPIERATHLLPQFYKKRNMTYNDAVNGLRQILWGLFKKIVIADSCAVYANEIFNNSETYSGSTLVIGALFFTFQIYGDFSGYSDIAIGTARMFGFDLKKNFNYPYFSRDIAEFWRKWHISLSTWFRDYLYIPLGGSRGGTWMKVRNVFIIFLVSGFWHGANWTFIFWGALNALYFLPLMLLKRNRIHTNELATNQFLPSFKDFFRILLTFSLTVLAWIFFRAENINHAFQYLGKIFSESLFVIPSIEQGLFNSFYLVFLIFVFIIVEWVNRNYDYGIQQIKKIRNRPLRWLIYLFILLIIYFYGSFTEEIEFIYFQF